MADKSHDKHWQRSIKMGFEKESQRRQVQKVKKQFKRNHQTKPARQKDWRPGLLAETEDDNFEPIERVMPRGERERRRAVMANTLIEATDEASNFLADFSAITTTPPGVVIEVSSGLCRVDLGKRLLICTVRGSLTAQNTGFTNLVAVGDHVIVSDEGSGRGVIEQILPRHSILARPDVFSSHLQQVIVANADQLLIVASWRNPSLWLELIDRYLIAAERSRLKPIICINKIDLAEALMDCQAALKPYQALGCRTIFASALTGTSIDTLRQVLRGQTTVLAGLSGVGKSSLLAAVQPGLQLRTGAVSQASGEGRHTTTQVTLLPLSGGGFVVDTPGIREFGLSGLPKSELIGFYPDLAAFAHSCRFADCTHRHEPDCAVKAAVAADKLPATRYQNYQKIYESLG